MDDHNNGASSSLGKGCGSLYEKEVLIKDNNKNMVHGVIVGKRSIKIGGFIREHFVIRNCLMSVDGVTPDIRISTFMRKRFPTAIVGFDSTVQMRFG